MKIARRFTKPGQDVFSTVEFENRTSRITNPDGSVVFEMNDAQIPKKWSQLATDIMVSKYFRKAGVPQHDSDGNPLRDADGRVITGPEKSVKQVINRLVGCWQHWGESHGYFDSTEDAQAFYDELSHMLLTQMCAPNSPQWFNTGLNWAYNITGPAQGHFYCDPKTGELRKGADAYTHPQPHACQPYRAPISTPRGDVNIGKIVTEKLVGLEIFDGTENGAGTTTVVAVKANGQKPVFRVVLNDGAAIEATADHLVYAKTSDGLTGRWVRVDALERGMFLVRMVRDRAAEKNISRNLPHNLHGDENTLTVPARTLQDRLIQRIEPLGIMPVFDIQTASGQYLSNNVLIHNCFIQSVSDDLVNAGGIMDLWTREARLFKYGSGTGSNFSQLRGEDEPLSGGGKSSGLMSFLKIGDRAAGAIKSGGTTRRAAKMVCLDLDHPDVEQFVNWKVREELKVAALAEGIKHLSDEQKATAKKLGLKLDYDFNGEAYATVSGQNSNNSVRIPNAFFKAVEEDGDWHLKNRTNDKIAKTVRARDLWEQIAYAAWRCADPGVQYDDTINQWHTCPKSGRINASNPCVTGDTRVLTPGGIWRRIDQMIHLPTRVVTNVGDQSIESTDGSFPTGTQDIYELRTAGGYSVKLTADHKVWTRSRGWVPAKDLLPSDEVRLPGAPMALNNFGHAFGQFATHPVGEPQDARLFQLLGLFLSSASNDPSAVHLDALAEEPDSAEDLIDYVSSTWAACDRVYSDDYTDPSMLTPQSPPLSPRRDTDRNTTAQNGSTLTAPLTNRRLLSRLKAYVKIESGTRRLSDDAFTAGLAAQKYLLRGLFTADATIENGIVEMRCDSLGLLHDIQMLLVGFGVKAGVFSDSIDSWIKQDSTQGNGRPSQPGRHCLRLDAHSLRTFAKYIGFLPGPKVAELAVALCQTIPTDRSRSNDSANYDRVATLTPLGRQQVFDLTEPVTHSFIANGLTVHNCSEYMFLDDTACNLASLNVLTFFDSEARHFDIEAFKHGIRLWTIVLEISVLMASFPSEEIAKLSYHFRTLGLGYANLGAMLMQAGIPYDSEKGRAICAAVTAILTGESYATSAEMARELKPFPGYEKNRADMLRVIRNHKRAAYDVVNNASFGRALGAYEHLDIAPVGINAAQFTDSDPLCGRQLLHAALECWDRALFLGERHGYRNAQTTVIAPTGTIGLLMDCDTTGVEPDFALVKFKKLAGGGYFKIANQSLHPALKNLGYSADEIHDILKYVMGSLTLHGAPHVNYETLRSRGLAEPELDKIESTLIGQFELSFAFSAWSFSPETFKRLEIPEAEWQAPGFNLLRRLGFTKKQIDDASAVICGNGTVEGAPHLKQEHYPVFDCANRCGKIGQRFIAPSGHIRMMAAAQPFISGAISKTINLPNEATLEEIKESYHLSWKLGLKANALYRDGSKLSQPLNAKSDAEADSVEEDDELNVAAAKDEIADIAVSGVLTSVSTSPARVAQITSDNLEPAPMHTHVIERIVERIVERPLRRRLPDTRNAVTHKFDVAGHEGYITIGLYEDGQPGEIFIRMAKEGSTIGGLMDTIATLVSVSLQYGVPVESLVRKFEHVRFEPSGMTRNQEIPMAKSLVDYIFRYLAMEFVPGYRAANAPKRPPKKASPALPPSPGTPGEGRGEGSAPALVSGGPQDRVNAKKANGHGPRTDPDPAKSFAYTDAELADASAKSQATEVDPIVNLRLALISSDPLSQQGTEMQSDAPACDVCGSITVRSGTCYKCMNCGNSMGCS
jgi:ribonucleoside-diphosphate reductase alpha chain